MEIRPIFSAMLRNRTGTVLIALQVAITLAIVVNALFIIHQRLIFMDRPTGLDHNNIIAIHGIGIGASVDPREVVPRELNLLRTIPGVKSVTAMGGIPFSGSGNVSTTRDGNDDKANEVNANRIYVDEHALDAMGVSLLKGRNFNATEIAWGAPEDQSFESQFPNQVIVSEPFANKLYPDGNALGNLVHDFLGASAEIIGIVEPMYGSYLNWEHGDQVMLFPKVSPGPYFHYLVRTEPGMAEQLIPRINEKLPSNRERLVRDVNLLSEIKARAYRNDRAMTIILTTVIVLLLLVTALGIVGLVSFSVRQRTKQIGTRRALGAAKFHILRYFFIENWLMTTLGAGLGTLLAIALNYWLVTEFEIAKLDIAYIPITIAIIWLLGLFAVLGPALRAANISPAVATRTV